MPGKSTFSKTQELITELCNIPDFEYDEAEMWSFIKMTDIKMKAPSSKSSKPRHTSAYSMFMKENKKGMDDTTVLSKAWNEMKDSNNEEYKRFVNMAEEKDKENGLEPSDGAKIQSQSQEKKLQIELIKTRAEGTDDEAKPIFSGKKVDSPTNNYKEWKKSQLGHPTTYTIPRKDLLEFQEEDTFDKKNMEGSDWDNYIRDNMLFLEDI
tara:strand:+ start:65 stop:691 length:627 start_codon:yes stop_codon:yes gene_type:complete